MLETKISQLGDLIVQSSNTVFFGGAGVSTESGIPDFRSESGLYAANQVYGYPPEDLLSYTFFLKQTELFFRYYKENMIADAKPNPAHIALAELEQQGKLAAVITQNIDGLHQAAGSRNVFELHGTNHRHYCIICREEHSLDYIMNPDNCHNGIIPVCKECGCIVRPDVVLYEESPNYATFTAAKEAIECAELLIVGGTSLVVYPAAELLNYFKGDNLVLINKGSTSRDEKAQLVINEPIGEVMEKIIEILEPVSLKLNNNTLHRTRQSFQNRRCL